MRSLVLVVLSALLAACAGTPRVATIPGAPVDPARVVDWTARGRMAIAFANDGGSGSFEWAQRAATTDLQLRGPLGAGALRIVTDGTSLAVTDADGQSLDSESARQRIRGRLGADLPLVEMRFWMLGLAAPGSEARVRAEGPATPREIVQSGWTVTFEPFKTVQGWSVPARLTAASGDARIKVILDEWQLPAADSMGAGAGSP
jgi:outer membrane lipoprotein LolB